MTINEEIVVLANQIANQGKKPTVALIKGKLINSVPLPIIISTLKGWQHDPSFITLTRDNTPMSIEKSTDSSEAEKLRMLLKEELAQMKEEIVELKQLIHELLAK